MYNNCMKIYKNTKASTWWSEQLAGEFYEGPERVEVDIGLEYFKRPW